MEDSYSVLIALQENLPDSYSEEHLHLLEQLATRYQEILNHVAVTSDPENVTLFYRERKPDLEGNLKEAKYGHSEKQRISGFNQAKEFLEKGINALLFQLNEQQKTKLSKDDLSASI